MKLELIRVGNSIIIKKDEMKVSTSWKYRGETDDEFEIRAREDFDKYVKEEQKIREKINGVILETVEI